MTFFNKKEDVIAIELTPHGRSLLSKGKLKPAFYAFFDDDILYDSQKAGFYESNSDTKNRILNQTPYLKPQTNYKGVESQDTSQITFETENHMLNPIGSNRIEFKKTNGWDITFLHNTASSVANSINESTSPILQIPQIETTITYKLKISNTVEALSRPGFEQLNPELVTADNFIDMTEEQVLIDIIETNGFNENENLEIEVFIYEQDQQSYKKLLTYEKDNLIKEGIFSQPTSNNNRSVFEINEKTANPDLVEYWLNIKVDEEIPLFDRCSGLKKLESNNIYLDGEIQCPDEVGALADIYATSVSELEDCEE